MIQNVSRRSFLVGAGLLGSAMAATMAGCAPKTGAGISAGNSANAGGNSGLSSTGEPSFLVAPEPITDIMETKEADVVVVGLGRRFRYPLRSGKRPEGYRHRALPGALGPLFTVRHLQHR